MSQVHLSHTMRFIPAVFMGSYDVKRDDIEKYSKCKFAAMKLATKFELLVMQCTNLDKGDRVECRATWTKLQCAFKRTPFEKKRHRVQLADGEVSHAIVAKAAESPNAWPESNFYPTDITWL